MASQFSQSGRDFVVGREGGMVDRNYNDQGGNCTFGAGTLVRHALRHPVHGNH